MIVERRSWVRYPDGTLAEGAGDIGRWERRVRAGSVTAEAESGELQRGTRG